MDKVKEPGANAGGGVPSGLGGGGAGHPGGKKEAAGSLNLPLPRKS